MSRQTILCSLSLLYNRPLSMPLSMILLYVQLANLVNCFTLLSAQDQRNTTLKNKCPSVPLLIPWAESQWNVSSESFANQLAINHLLRAFGLERYHAERRTRHSSPPQYMLDLYSMASNQQNYNTIYMKHNSKIVRSVTNTDTSHHFHFCFNISGLIPPNEQVLEAEFHIFKLRSHLKIAEKLKDPRHHLLEVRVYQILSEGKNDSDMKKRLLDVRRMSTHSFGWDVFYVKQAVLDWIKQENSNYGLLVTVVTMLKENMKNGIRFARRYHHHANRQPIIVIFSTDSKVDNSPIRTAKLDNNNYDYGFSELSQNKNATNKKVVDLSHKQWNDSLSLSSSSSSSSGMNGCSRHELYIDFESIGWSSWIISPKGYSAYYCKGQCSSQNGFANNAFANNHLTPQSISHPFNSSTSHLSSCCAPNKLNPLNVLFFDERGNVVLKRYDDMVVHSCGCHSYH